MTVRAPPSPAVLTSILLGQLAFGLLAMTICLPSMQEWGAIFSASQAAVQLTFSGYVVGLVTHQDGVNLAVVMLAFTLCAAVAQVLLLLHWPRPMSVK